MSDARKIGEKIGIKWEEVPFTLDQFEKSVNAEMEEHHDDPETKVIDTAREAGKVAWAHLKEDPKYYDKLAKIEESIAKGDENAFWEYMVCHNQEDRDSGEIEYLSDKEKKRLEREWQSLPPKDKLRYHRQVKSTERHSMESSLEESTDPIFAKIEEKTVTAEDFNQLIQEETPESIRNRVRRRPMAQERTVKSHQDNETGHAKMGLPKIADRVQPARKPEHQQDRGRGDLGHRHSARTQKRTMSKSLAETGRFAAAIQFILEWYGKPFADYNKLLAEIEDRTAVTIVARKLMAKPGANRDWLSDVCKQMEVSCQTTKMQ